MKLIKTNLCKSVVFLSLFFFVSCSVIETKRSLYERLGGFENIHTMVSETIDQASTDPRTSRSFKDVKLKQLKTSVSNQICLLSGGNCVYEGDTMKKSHADAKITEAEFELFVSFFRDALNRHVNEREKNELLKLLAPMKRDIVWQP